MLLNWCWRRVLRVPWTARRSNQSILKEISPEYSLKGLMLKLKLQYFGHLMWRADSLEKTLMLGKIERRRRGQQRMRWLDGISDSMDMSLSKLQEMLKHREACRAAVHGVAKSQIRQRDWTTISLKKRRAAKNCHHSSPHKIHNELLNPGANRVLTSPLLPSRSPKWLSWIFNFWIFYLSLKFIDSTCRYMLELFVD